MPSLAMPIRATTSPCSLCSIGLWADNACHMHRYKKTLQLSRAAMPTYNLFKPFLSSRKLGDSNPRYGYPYGSLANCWFQPLTQTSLMTEQAFFKCGANVRQSFGLCKLFCPFFRTNLEITSYLHQKATYSRASKLGLPTVLAPVSTALRHAD